jgi:hypothetical protein
VEPSHCRQISGTEYARNPFNPLSKSVDSTAF